MTLRDAQVGSTVVVTKIEGDSAYKRRIMDMGITKGSESRLPATRTVVKQPCSTR